MGPFGDGTVKAPPRRSLQEPPPDEESKGGIVPEVNSPNPDGYIREMGPFGDGTVKAPPRKSSQPPLPPAQAKPQVETAPKELRHPRHETSESLPGDVMLTGVDTTMRALAAAETGKVTEERPLDHESRFIRTKAGADSSAYGPYQITKSLAEGHVKNGLFDSDPELKKWTKERFVPHGKKMLRADYSDPVYGAGGKGDLNNEYDREMYQKMARAIIAENYQRNQGDTLQVLGEHRFGGQKKNTLLRNDPKYAEKAIAQMKRDEQLVMASSNIGRPREASVSPAPIDNSQVALSNLSKEYDSAKMTPIVMPIPASPPQAPAAQQSPSSMSTKTTGASPNGASDSSWLLAQRMSVAPV